MQQGMPMEPVYYAMQNGPPQPPFPGNQGGFPMAMQQQQQRPPPQQQYSNPAQQMHEEEASEEMQRQMYGEQLYVLVQPMCPSEYLAQKVTGMLLELPMSELCQNLTNPEELRRRVSEALEVLRNDGLD